jgi:ribonuclease III
MKEITGLQDIIGVTFANLLLLEQSMVHRSFLNEHRSFHLDHNERLEFLGDAVLEIVVTDFLFHEYDFPEGELTSIRSALVNTDMLAIKARALHLDEYLRLSKGETMDVGRARDVILANAFEAVIGAIYLDQGLDAARGFISAQLFGDAAEIVEKKLYRDPKSKLQEIAQEKFRVTPEYRVIDETGPDHNKQFTIGVFFGDDQMAVGSGSSKQQAQVDAAVKALGQHGW